MRMKGSQDLAAGLMFFLIGIISLVIGSNYPVGSWQRPGTGVLPTILAWCLIGIGGLIAVKGFMAGGHSLFAGAWAWRPVVMVTLASMAFAFLVDGAGLVVAMAVSMTICALGTRETRWREFAIFLAFMATIGVGLFIKGLGMPIKVFPWS
jgi:hypothetical protein